MSKHSVYAQERRDLSQMDSRSFNRSRRSDPVDERHFDFGSTPHKEVQMTTQVEQTSLIKSPQKREQLPEIVET